MVIEDVLIYNDGVFRDLIQCGDAKYIMFVLLSFNLWRFWVTHRWISAIQCYKFFKDDDDWCFTASFKFFKEEEKFNSLSWFSDIYSCVSSAYKWFFIPYRCAMIPKRRVYIVKTRGPRTERQIKYYEYTLSGSAVSERIEIIHALCLTDRTCHFTQGIFSLDKRLFQCSDHFYMQTVVIH